MTECSTCRSSEEKRVSGYFGYWEGFRDDVAQKYINSELKLTGSVCRGHEHE